MGFISSIMGMFGFEFGFTSGILIGYFMFIYYLPTDVKLKSISDKKKMESKIDKEEIAAATKRYMMRSTTKFLDKVIASKLKE